MKKWIALLLALFILLPLQSFAQVTKSNNVDIHFFEYRAGLDRYILDYTLRDYADAVVTIFITPSNVTYTKSWGAWAVNRKIYHNCNGTFNYHFEVNGEIVGYIYGLETTQIQNEICQQEMPGSNDNDLNTRITDNGQTGNKRINYDENGSNNYRLQRSTDGGTTWNDYLTNTDTGTGTGYFEVGQAGDYRIISEDQNGNITDKDYIGPTEFDTNKCNGCRTLTEMLKCPAWDDYMGEFSEMIAGAVPAPPNINEGMDYLIEKLAEQSVEPEQPEAPTPFDPGYQEQQIDLPQPIETEINPPETDFEPETGGNGSGPVNITDPGAWVPDDTDAGYNPPNPDPDNAPNYNPPEMETENPPTYNPPSGSGENPPTYNAPGSPTDNPPTYNAPGSQTDTPPNYNINNGGSTVPNYQYN